VWVNISSDGRPENIRSIIAGISVVLVAGMIGFNVVLPNNDINIGIGVLIVCTASMVLCIYGGPAFRAVASGSAEGTDYLIVGICLSWLATDLREVLVIVGRLANFPPSLFNAEFWAPIKLLYPIAAVLHVLPKGALDGVVPKGNKLVVLWTFACATLIALAVLAYHPNTSDLIDRMPMWMRDYWGTGQAGTVRTRAG
jgi:hypothetical protein